MQSLVEIGPVVLEKKGNGRTDERNERIFLKWSVYNLTPLRSLRSLRGLIFLYKNK